MGMQEDLTNEEKAAHEVLRKRFMEPVIEASRRVYLLLGYKDVSAQKRRHKDVVYTYWTDNCIEDEFHVEQKAGRYDSEYLNVEVIGATQGQRPCGIAWVGDSDHIKWVEQFQRRIEHGMEVGETPGLIVEGVRKRTALCYYRPTKQDYWVFDANKLVRELRATLRTHPYYFTHPDKNPGYFTAGLLVSESILKASESLLLHLSTVGVV